MANKDRQQNYTNDNKPQDYYEQEYQRQLDEFNRISGAGGQLDFVLGAYKSKGGKSFICCSSTVPTKDGSLKSRIKPCITEGGIITATRANTQYLVTEYGLVNLKGASTWERAEKIISVCHPDLRDELIEEADKMHIWNRTNKRV